MRKEQTESVPVHYESIAAWSKRSGMTVGSIYQRLKSGELRGVKLGRRTLIDVQRGLQWLENDPWQPSGPVSRRTAKQKS
jgi:hypothetical protein